MDGIYTTNGSDGRGAGGSVSSSVFLPSVSSAVEDERDENGDGGANLAVIVTVHDGHDRGGGRARGRMLSIVTGQAATDVETDGSETGAGGQERGAEEGDVLVVSACVSAPHAKVEAQQAEALRAKREEEAKEFAAIPVRNGVGKGVVQLAAPADNRAALIAAYRMHVEGPTRSTTVSPSPRGSVSGSITIGGF